MHAIKDPPSRHINKPKSLYEVCEMCCGLCNVAVDYILVMEFIKLDCRNQLNLVDFVFFRECGWLGCVSIPDSMHWNNPEMPLFSIYTEIQYFCESDIKNQYFCFP